MVAADKGNSDSLTPSRGISFATVASHGDDPNLELTEETFTVRSKRSASGSWCLQESKG